MSDEISAWQQLARQLRVDSIRISTRAGSGHPTSSLSAADLMAVLVSKYLRYDISQPDSLANDQLVFSKGHASPLFYSIFRAMDAISDKEFLTYRTFGSRLEGHPTPRFPYAKVATGSLGQGLGMGIGMALSAEKLENSPARVWVLLGDSEMTEGSVWEALDHGGDLMLGNIVAIIDVNRLGQTGETSLGWNTDAYAERARAFGWRAIVVDGHNMTEIDEAFGEAERHTGPTVIVAKTIKGKGVSFLENALNWHGKTLSEEQAQKAYAELGEAEHITVTPQKPPAYTPKPRGETKPPALKPIADATATRQAYGLALQSLGATDPNVVVLDAEVGNSTYSELFEEKYPDRFFETYIREQEMIATSVGLQTRGWVPFAATFGAFISRAADFIRMAAISRANIKVCGSHAGVSIGQDGPSQMALEDIALLRAITGSSVLYPCDANQTQKLVAAMAAHRGIDYIRTTREKTPIIYSADEQFEIGGSKVLRQSDADQATVVAAGITVVEALEAYDELKKDGITIRVIDCYSVKPIDVFTLHTAAKEVGSPFVVVEDHRPEGGLGDAVLDAFTQYAGPFPLVTKLAVQEMPESGTPEELRDFAGIDAEHIILAVKTLLVK